jgi:hypothetical protein
VQADRVDKSAVGFDYQGKTEKHESQKGAGSLSSPSPIFLVCSQMRACCSVLFLRKGLTV